MLRSSLQDAAWILSGVGVPAVVAIIGAAGRSLLGAASLSRGVGVAGRWKIYIDSNKHPGPHGSIELRQAFTWVWGIAQLDVTEGGNTRETRQYRYKGRQRGDQVLLTFSEEGPDARLIGATVIKIGARGEELACMNAFWDHSDITAQSKERRRRQLFRLVPGASLKNRRS